MQSLHTHVYINILFKGPMIPIINGFNFQVSIVCLVE